MRLALPGVPWSSHGAEFVKQVKRSLKTAVALVRVSPFSSRKRTLRLDFNAGMMSVRSRSQSRFSSASFQSQPRAHHTVHGRCPLLLADGNRRACDGVPIVVVLYSDIGYSSRVCCATCPALENTSSP